MPKAKYDKEALASFFLRTGLAIVFFYAAISSFLFPENWTGFIPAFIRSVFPAGLFLNLHALGEVALGLWLLSNKKIFYASIVSILAILTIIIFNLTLLDIVFRDVAILFMAVALSALSYKRK